MIDTTRTAPRTDSAAMMLAAARELAPELMARAREAELLGSMPSDLVARIRSARLFRILQPRALGGLELEPVAVLEIIEELSRADASAGWTVMIGAGSLAFAAWLQPGVACDLFGRDADATVATVFAPSGRARADVAGRLSVQGRWAFASGCRHAEWFLNGVLVMDGEAPRLLEDGTRDWRLAYVPRSAAEIVDNWDVVGLRGTGSNDVRVAAVSIPEEHAIRPFFESPHHDGPLWRLPFFTLAGVTFAGFALGVGRRALDDFTDLAVTRLRAMASEPVARDAAAQVEFARAEGGLRAARAFVFEAVGDVWRSALAGDVPSVPQRARLQLAAHQAMESSVQAVETAYKLAGSAAVSASHPLQRSLRDVHTAAQHGYFSTEGLKRYARTRFDIPQPTFML